MGEAQRDVWLLIARGVSSQHVRPSDIPLLRSYCEATVLCDRAAAELEAEGPVVKGRVNPCAGADYLVRILDVMKQAEAEIGVEAAHLGMLLMVISAASKHKSVAEVCDWLESTAQDMRDRIVRH